jgi:acyl transferase domain-containing protein
MPLGEAYLCSLRARIPCDARQLLHVPYAATATRLARALDIRGPVVSPSIACASGTQAVGLALELIRRGQADAFVVGGAEIVCHFVVSGQLRATTADAVRPFDARRDGLPSARGDAGGESPRTRARGVAPDVEAGWAVQRRRAHDRAGA